MPYGDWIKLGRKPVASHKHLVRSKWVLEMSLGQSCMMSMRKTKQKIGWREGTAGWRGSAGRMLGRQPRAGAGMVSESTLRS